ncbi:uncharacterized protein LOC135330274 [Dromaius novaehollandiae]|uniref:uncharacterized protein LOC135330274 n=1 Tax=Dromaius novaehollandiae TaxID=8790 RepID=UPI00311DEC6C
MPPAICSPGQPAALARCSRPGARLCQPRSLASPLPAAAQGGLFAVSGTAASRVWLGPAPGRCVKRGRKEPLGARAGGSRARTSGCLRPRQPGPQRSSGTAMRLLPLLLLAALGCAAKPKRPAADEGADAQRAAPKGCANLTVVLDNWKFAITSQMRNLLLFDHETVLPDYGRIRSLSGALDHLYEDFSALKEQLGQLTARFAEVEAFAEELSGAQRPTRRRRPPPPARRPPATPH